MIETDYATPRDLADEYLKCRVLNHEWDANPEPNYSPALWASSAGALAIRCERCKTERYDYIGKDMGLAARRYKYPKGYARLSRIDGARPVLRRELFRRSLVVQSYKRRANGKVA